MNSRPVVLITGSGQRLGQHIALYLASQGFDVAVHYRHSAQSAVQTVAQARQAGAAAEAFAADLADEAQCKALLPTVATAMGRVDAVVHSASVFEWDDAASFSYAAMDKHWRTNTAPTIVLAQALKHHLQQRLGASLLEPKPGQPAATAPGCVVSLSDQKLSRLNPDHLSYTLSKAALQTATVMLAQVLAPWVRVCAVAPGISLPGPGMSQAEFEAAHKMTPLGYASSPQDIAQAVCYLLKASAVTGHTLVVDGGTHLAAQARDVAFLVQP